jgi:hypothetical protein
MFNLPVIATYESQITVTVLNDNVSGIVGGLACINPDGRQKALDRINWSAPVRARKSDTGQE